MSSPEILWALATYAFVMTITPGPNNLLLLSSGLTFGLSRTGRHMAGILSGVLLQICVTGAGLGILFARFPDLQTVLKLAGTLYMLWLAERLWRASEPRDPTLARPIGFGAAMLFQFVNPKSWIMATTVITAFVPAGEAYAGRVLTAGLIFTGVALPCVSIWAASGAWLRSLVRDTVARQRINRSMAALSALTAILFWQ
ncbi:LysE family translocator [Azovibrio restrictus]|uniref:LysE family translocator n=1 Tax=Azovibrio restrictus TaxID=146938 RepID=UPI0026EE625A|nr:LysE family translocator [Azovibrio restrictus]